MPIIKKRCLIVAAGCMWIIAGVNVFRIGFEVWQTSETVPWLHFAGVIITFLFFSFIFKRAYTKNVIRISTMENTRNPLSFFDVKGWLIIAFMITLGVTVRHFGLLPKPVIAAFYQGLGSSLAVFGIRFLWTALGYAE